jgi:putative membrane-bound dehydrogenase-like protein
MKRCSCWFVLLLAFDLAALAVEPPAVGRTISLFDGRTLNGWEGDAKLWRVEDGALTGGSLTETIRQNEFLATRREFTNFIVRFKIKLTGAGGFINSGFQIRSQRVANSSEMSGYQCDFGDPNWWGAIYDESRRDRVLSPSDMSALAPVLKRNDWNDYVIRADGPRITTWINGVQGTDYYESEFTIPDFGKLGIQVHGGGKALVQVKEVTIEELPATPAEKRFIGAPEPAKPSQPSPLPPDEQRKAFTLPPGFEVELVAAEEPGVGKFITVDWDQQGRMWSMTAFEYPVDANESPAEAKALYENPGKDKVVVFDTPFAPGRQSPRVFADGLAIPLGILPYRNGVYVQHGPDILYLNDTNADGKADRRQVVLSGFGVQDSHLFPHQFMRAPGNWIWIAQGAFNYGKVKTPNGEPTPFDATRMARFRLDGSGFDVTSQGPCNIWGLVLGAEGEVWIQEANDYGFPVMPFHEYANYPGCSDRYFKSYAPEFPGTADFRLGGTGLSGLALSDKTGAWPEPYADVMYIANPITRRVNSIKIHRDGPRYKLQRLPDLVASSDEMFRPVSIHFGPDGCLYIVDWYNKIISHNEVPRNHPERDKMRGRIWRVKHSGQQPFPMVDFTRLNESDLLAKLGGNSLRQSHLAWQAIRDRRLTNSIPQLKNLLGDKSLPAPKRIAALWALEGLGQVDALTLEPLLQEANRNIRREAARSFGELKGPRLLPAISPLIDDHDPEVRAQVIRSAGLAIAHPWSGSYPKVPSPNPAVIGLLAKAGRASLSEPTAPATRDGRPIKVREAYEREFERYLVRLFLEQQPEAVAAWLDSAEGKALPLENRLLVALALEPKASATRVAALLPQLSRPPSNEETLRLAEFSDDLVVSAALATLLRKPATRTPVLQALLSSSTRFDSTRLKPLLAETTRELFTGDAAGLDLALRVASSFQLSGLEPELLALLDSSMPTNRQVTALRALREIGSSRADVFARVATNSVGGPVRDEALNSLAACKSDQAGPLLLSLWPELNLTQRRAALGKLASTRPGGESIVKAVRSGVIAKADLDGATVDKLETVLADNGEFRSLLEEIAHLYRPVLRLNGTEEAFTEPEITLDGPFTVETWVRLDPGINNNDGILGAPGQLDMNFHDATFRVWMGDHHDVIVTKKRMVPDFWTHLAVTRDEKGLFKIYINGALDTDTSKPVPTKLEHLRIGWTAPNKGTAGELSEFRVWNRERKAEEIQANLDRSFEGQPKPSDLVFYATGKGPWGKLASGASISKTSDFPPVLTAKEAADLDAKFVRLALLAGNTGDKARGRLVANTCIQCHLIQGQGGKIGPDLSGAGAVGTESLLRNLLNPNAAMEPGYRTYRVELRDGDILDGLYVSEDNASIVLRMQGAEDRRIPKKDIRQSGFIRRSLMPEGLLEAMQPQEVSDLFAFLKTLK